jgi:hypothetical protein
MSSYIPVSGHSSQPPSIKGSFSAASSVSADLNVAGSSSFDVELAGSVSSGYPSAMQADPSYHLNKQGTADTFDASGGLYNASDSQPHNVVGKHAASVSDDSAGAPAFDTDIGAFMTSSTDDEVDRAHSQADSTVVPSASTDSTSRVCKALQASQMVDPSFVYSAVDDVIPTRKRWVNPIPGLRTLASMSP